MPEEGKTGSELFPCIDMRLKYTCIGMRLHLRRQRQVACSGNINRARGGRAAAGGGGGGGGGGAEVNRYERRARKKAKAQMKKKKR